MTAARPFCAERRAGHRLWHFSASGRGGTTVVQHEIHTPQGYLARARTKGEPSFPLAALLYLLAQHPKNLGVLQGLSG